jgi:hypothetical protein
MEVAANPLGADIQAQIQTNLVVQTETSFNFRKDREFEEKNPAALGKTKRTSFKLNLPLLTRAGVIAALSAQDRTTDLVVELANESIVNRAKKLINDQIDEDKFNLETLRWGVTLKAEMFDPAEFGFLKIATLPKSERGSGIPKEAWAAFVIDYKEVMATQKAIDLIPDHKARPPEILEKHGQLLGGKFNAVRSRKDVIGQMLGFLDIWVQASDNAEEHMACYDHLKTKGDILMKAEEFKDL